MNINIILKVLSKLKTEDYLDAEIIGYDSKKYSFSYKEYCEVFYFLLSKVKMYDIKDSMFYEQIGLLKYNKEFYILRILTGQGTAIQIHTKDSYENWSKKKFNNNLFVDLQDLL